MNLDNLETLCRLTVPGAKDKRVTSPRLQLIINQVVNNINFRLRLLRTDDFFGVTADKYKYDLSSSDETVSKFAKIDKPGLWWNAGTADSPDWKELRPRTLKWLDKNRPKWRNASSGDPEFFVKHGKFLYIHPTPSADLAGGFHLYFIERTETMTQSGHYPFGYDIEIPEYAILTDVILKGVEYFLLPMVGKKDSQRSVLQEYQVLIEQKRRELHFNPAIASSGDARLRLPHVC